MVGAKMRLISICFDSVQQKERRAPHCGPEGYYCKAEPIESIDEFDNLINDTSHHCKSSPNTVHISE